MCLSRTCLVGDWWVVPYIASNTFPGYTFKLGHKYRITRGTWGPCTPWSAVSKSIYLSTAPSDAGPALTVETDTTYRPAPPDLSAPVRDETVAGAAAAPSDVRPAAVQVWPNPARDRVTI